MKGDVKMFGKLTKAVNFSLPKPNVTSSEVIQSAIRSL